MKQESDGSLIIETAEESDGIKGALFYLPAFGLEDQALFGAKLFYRIAIEGGKLPLALDFEESELAKSAITAVAMQPELIDQIFERHYKNQMDQAVEENGWRQRFPNRNKPVYDLEEVKHNLLTRAEASAIRMHTNTSLVARELERLAA